jgi:hypothetical protein
MLSIETIMRVAHRHGYLFSPSTCLDLLEDSWEGETVADAIVDYLCAYEGTNSQTIRAIYEDEEAQATL